MHSCQNSNAAPEQTRILPCVKQPKKKATRTCYPTSFTNYIQVTLIQNIHSHKA
uniref:Uncharacterized protein n=1 Tax=Arundo donax TaxID=35708 RepID=A0A0A8Y0T9_ARUDO